MRTLNLKHYKTLSLLLALSLTSISLSAKPLKFSLKGEIQDIEKGDTLRFERVLLPDWKLEPGFELIVKENGKFTHKGTHEHTQLYLMTCRPTGSPIPKSDKSGLSILIKDGKIKIAGKREYLYTSTISGGFYDKELTQIKSLQDSLSRTRSKLIRKITENTKDSAARMNTISQLNNFRTANSSIFTRIENLEKDYKNNNSNEYIASDLCQKSWLPLAEFEAECKKLSKETLETYYGKKLISILGNLKKMASGQSLPDYTLETKSGESISLSNLKGKYLIIYYYGLCPGSFAIDSRVIALYEKYKDKLEVIGITDSFQSIKDIYDTLPEKESSVGKTLKGMTNHPWKHEAEIQNNEKNQPIISEFSISGLPYFICVYPDGKILSTGYGDSFRKIEQELTQEPQ